MRTPGTDAGVDPGSSFVELLPSVNHPNRIADASATPMVRNPRHRFVLVASSLALAVQMSACGPVHPRPVGAAQLPSAQGNTFCATTRDGRPISDARARRIDQLDVFIRQTPPEIDIAKRSHRPDIVASMIDSLATALHEWDVRTADIISCDGTTAPLPAFSMERKLAAERSSP